MSRHAETIRASLRRILARRFPVPLDADLEALRDSGAGVLDLELEAPVRSRDGAPAGRSSREEGPS